MRHLLSGKWESVPCSAPVPHCSSCLTPRAGQLHRLPRQIFPPWLLLAAVSIEQPRVEILSAEIQNEKQWSVVLCACVWLQRGFLKIRKLLNYGLWHAVQFASFCSEEISNLLFPGGWAAIQLSRWSSMCPAYTWWSTSCRRSRAKQAQSLSWETRVFPEVFNLNHRFVGEFVLACFYSLIKYSPSVKKLASAGG